MQTERSGQSKNLYFHTNTWFHTLDIGNPPGYWNLTFSYCLFSKKVVFFIVLREKNEMYHFCPPWKNIFGFLWKNPLLVLPWKESFRRPCLLDKNRYVITNEHHSFRCGSLWEMRTHNGKNAKSSAVTGKQQQGFLARSGSLYCCLCAVAFFK